jgi:hypothetical protein
MVDRLLERSPFTVHRSPFTVHRSGGAAERREKKCKILNQEHLRIAVNLSRRFVGPSIAAERRTLSLRPVNGTVNGEGRTVNGERRKIWETNLSYLC